MPLACLLSAIAFANQGYTYDRSFAEIPMRDGVMLHTAIWRPRGVEGKLPFILLRTPYGADGWNVADDYLKAMANDGYIFVFQDIRGRYKSQGIFEMMRPIKHFNNSKAVDESTDTYDSLGYLVKNVPDNNGRAGMLGISYDGWTTVMGMIDPHPALKCASPQSSPADMWLGDDFHHNGAFRLSYGFEYVALMETNKGQSIFSFDRFDTYDWYMRLGALSNANAKYLKGKLPTWNDFVDHPNYDAFWQRQATWKHLKKVTVPTLNVTGWWDQEDYWGPLKIYSEFEKHDTEGKNFLVIGPWNHGGWADGPGSKLDKIEFGAPTGPYFREKVQAAFFAYYLKNKGEGQFPQALTFNTGRNRWVSRNAWPPVKGVQRSALYLRESHGLSFSPPADSLIRQSSIANRKSSDLRPATCDRYYSDPAHPVPYRPRPIGPTYPFAGWPTWLVQDQRFVEGRPDVLTYQTAPLKDDVTIAGPVTAKLWAATTGTDSDWIVKLIDVYPGLIPENRPMSGYQLMIDSEVFRGRYRQSFEKPRAMAPNRPELYTIDLHAANHTFLKGHRIMVQVQSSWFPVIDRNPQTFVPNIFKAKDSDYKPAWQSLYRTKAMPSRVEVWVEPPSGL